MLVLLSQPQPMCLPNRLKVKPLWQALAPRNGEWPWSAKCCRVSARFAYDRTEATLPVMGDDGRSQPGTKLPNAVWFS